MTSPSDSSPLPPPDVEIVDFVKLRDYARFVLRSPLHHPWIATGVALGVFGMAVLSLVALPKTYHVDAEIMAQRNLLMPALGNPGRAVPFDADAPTRAAAEIVRRRDNLVSLIKQTGLVDRWEITRAPAGRAKDWVFRTILGPPTEEDRIDSLVGTLEKQLLVNTGEGTVTISIDWPDPQLAAQLVETAQQNFLEARHAIEVSSIAESISILERHAASVQESIDSAMEEVKRTRSTRTTRPEPGRRDVPVAPRPKESSETQQLKVVLDGKRRAIRDLEEYRKRRLTELQTELAQQRQVFADAHPTIVRLVQSISALNEDSPQLADLRREERDLSQEWTRLSGQPANDEREKDDETTGYRPASVLPQARRLLEGTEGAAEEYTKARLRFAMSKYESLVERIDAARIELDTARAAFKYRYSVIRPAQIPKRAIKPVVPVVLGLGAVMGLFFAFSVAAFLDLRSGKLMERWQVERMLGVPFLGRMNRTMSGVS